MKTYNIESNLSGVCTVYLTGVKNYMEAVQIRNKMAAENPKRVFYVRKIES